MVRILATKTEHLRLATCVPSADPVVPFAVELVAFDGHGCIFTLETVPASP